MGGPGGPGVYDPSAALNGGGATGAGGFPLSVPTEYQINAGQKVPGLLPFDVAPFRNLSPQATRRTPSGAILMPHGGDVGAASVQHLTLQEGLLDLIKMGTLDESQLVTLQHQMIKAGFLNPQSTTFTPGSVAPGDATFLAYAKLLNDSVAQGQNYKNILQHRINDPKNTQGQRFWQYFQQHSGNKPVDKTYDTTSVNYIDPAGAAAIGRNAYEAELGREATPQEAQAVYAALTAYQQAHPSNTTSTVRYDPATGMSPEVRSSVTTGGVDQTGLDELATDQVLAQHGAEVAHTQGDQIYQLLASMLGGTSDTSALGGPG